MASSDDAAIVLINPDPGAPARDRSRARCSARPAAASARFEDVTPDGQALPFEPGQPISARAADSCACSAARPRRCSRSPGAARRRAAGGARSACWSSPRNRVVIERVEPELDGGRHPIKRVVGDVVDGRGRHLLRRPRQDRGGASNTARRTRRTGARRRWRSSTTTAGAAASRSTATRRYLYTIEAWRDLFESWRDEVDEEARRRARRRPRADRGPRR